MSKTRLQTSPHVTQTTYGSCLNHVTHGIHPFNACCICSVCRKSMPSRYEPWLAHLVKVSCSIPNGPRHDTPSKTEQTKRATYTTTSKIPSSELLTYTHKDNRSRTSLFSRPVTEHPKSSLQTFPSRVHLRLQKNRKCFCLDRKQSVEQNLRHEMILKCRQISGTAAPHNL